MIDIQNIVEDSLNELWAEYKNEEFCKFSPNSIKEVPDNGLIFIGLNPSLIERVKKRLIEKNDISCSFHKLIYDKKKEYKYFHKFFEVAEKTDLNWGHIDILYNRETNQKNIEKLYKTDRGKKFIEKQFEISREVIDHLIDPSKPRIFVVTNALAREYLGKFFDNKPDEDINYRIGYNFIWNEDLGTYFYKNNAFFFTSMLTGQRSLDNGSYKRLIWHINFIKDKLSIKSTLHNTI
ncbi:MAG: hypothetical protein WDZ35_09125 [Crocinitomicaceae bacterium]